MSPSDSWNRSCSLAQATPRISAEAEAATHKMMDGSLRLMSYLCCYAKARKDNAGAIKFF